MSARDSLHGYQNKHCFSYMKDTTAPLHVSNTCTRRPLTVARHSRTPLYTNYAPIAKVEMTIKENSNRAKYKIQKENDTNLDSLPQRKHQEVRIEFESNANGTFNDDDEEDEGDDDNDDENDDGDGGEDGCDLLFVCLFFGG